MELSKKDTNIIKGIAIIFLVFLHLFNTKDYVGKFQPILFYNNLPVEYYLSLVAGSCVSIYLFCSGYGLAMVNKNKELNIASNIIRVAKLLINYWIILILFVIIGYIMGRGNEYPGSIYKFILNFLLLSKSYNGAWWFLQTYVILVLLSKVIINIVNKYNSMIVFIISGGIYFITFIISLKGLINVGDNEIIKMIYTSFMNLLNCQFAFIAGIVFVKEKIISKIRYKLSNNRYSQLFCYISIILVILINCVIENFIIDPITAIAIICILSVIKINEGVKSILQYLSTHSTNIWLTHMFFYMIFFEKLVYAPKYSILIFLWLMIICIITSYMINHIYKIILRLVMKNINRNICITEFN